ncbi:MAG: hypothetical protein GTN69_10550 [Armatimonadetes bacterium]|nr:hypothetical protein [Armatimonadota bacterium]
MIVNAPPEKLAALQRGETVVLVVEMERQPKWEEEPSQLDQDPNVWCGRYRIAARDDNGDYYDDVGVDEMRQPIAHGDPVEVVCGTCGGWVRNDVMVEMANHRGIVFRDQSPCACLFGKAQTTARTIKPCETSGRWVWEVEVGK